MKIFILTLTTLLFLTSCGTTSQESDVEVSGQFISDSKNYTPPTPPGYEEKYTKNSSGVKKDD